MKIRITPHGILAPGRLCYADPDLVDQAAAAAHPSPTPAQRKAGNYRCGHTTIQGLDITIETAAGSRRKPEWPPLANHYGYIKRTRSAADGDHVDVFLGPDPASELVFIVDQVKPGGEFDEHKVMVGFRDQGTAEAAYRANYDPDWLGFGGMRCLSMAEFKTWLEHGDTGRPVQLQRIDFAIVDASGHMHKGPGPGGGQFTGKNDGGGASTPGKKTKAAAKAKSKPGQRASAYHGKYQAILAEAKAAQAQAVQDITKDAQTARKAAAKHSRRIDEAREQLSTHGKINAPFEDLARLTEELDVEGDQSPAEQFQLLKQVEAKAHEALQANLPLSEGESQELEKQLMELHDQKTTLAASIKEWKAELTRLASERAHIWKQQTSVEGALANAEYAAAKTAHEAYEKEVGPKIEQAQAELDQVLDQTHELAESLDFDEQAAASNAAHLQAIIASARAARQQLRDHVHYRKELKALKSGDTSSFAIRPDGTLPG